MIINGAAGCVIDAGATFTATDDAAITTNDFAGGTVENRGTFIKSGGTGTTVFHGELLDNTGTVDVDTGSIVTQQGIAQINDQGTLTAGTWMVADGATLNVPGQNIATNAATVRLIGPDASLPQLAPLSSNTGTLELLAGKAFTTAGDLSNSGSITLGPWSRLNVHGAYTQTRHGAADVAGRRDVGFGTVRPARRDGGGGLDGTLAVTLADGFGPRARRYLHPRDLRRARPGSPQFSKGRSPATSRCSD